MDGLSQRAVAGQIGSPEPVNALLGVSDDQERLGVGMCKERLEDLDLQCVAVLAFIQDGCLEPAANCPGHGPIGALCGQGVAYRQEDVVEGANPGQGFALRELGLDALGQARGRELFFGKIELTVFGPEFRERRRQILDL